MRNPYNKVRTGIHSLNANLNVANNARSNSLNAIVKSVKKLEAMSPENRAKHEAKLKQNTYNQMIAAEKSINKLSESTKKASRLLSEQRSSLARSGLSGLGNIRSATTMRWKPSGGKRNMRKTRRGTRRN